MMLQGSFNKTYCYYYLTGCSTAALAHRNGLSFLQAESSSATVFDQFTNGIYDDEVSSEDIANVLHGNIFPLQPEGILKRIQEEGNKCESMALKEITIIINELQEAITKLAHWDLPADDIRLLFDARRDEYNKINFMLKREGKGTFQVEDTEAVCKSVLSNEVHKFMNVRAQFKEAIREIISEDQNTNPNDIFATLQNSAEYKNVKFETKHLDTVKTVQQKIIEKQLVEDMFQKICDFDRLGCVVANQGDFSAERMQTMVMRMKNYQNMNEDRVLQLCSEFEANVLKIRDTLSTGMSFFGCDKTSKDVFLELWNDAQFENRQGLTFLEAEFLRIEIEFVMLTQVRELKTITEVNADPMLINEIEAIIMPKTPENILKVLQRNNTTYEEKADLEKVANVVRELELGDEIRSITFGKKDMTAAEIEPILKQNPKYQDMTLESLKAVMKKRVLVKPIHAIMWKNKTIKNVNVVPMLQEKGFKDVDYPTVSRIMTERWLVIDVSDIYYNDIGMLHTPKNILKFLQGNPQWKSVSLHVVEDIMSYLYPIIKSQAGESFNPAVARLKNHMKSLSKRLEEAVNKGKTREAKTIQKQLKYFIQKLLTLQQQQ